jgi:hypothetical protein
MTESYEILFFVFCWAGRTTRSSLPPTSLIAMSDDIPSAGYQHLPLGFYDHSMFYGAFSPSSVEYIQALANEAERIQQCGQTERWQQPRALVAYHASYPSNAPQLFFRDSLVAIDTGMVDRVGNVLTFYGIVRAVAEWVDMPGYIERSITVEAHVTPGVCIDWTRTFPWPHSPAHSNYLEPHHFCLAHHKPIPMGKLTRSSVVSLTYSYEILNIKMIDDERCRAAVPFTRRFDTCFIAPITPTLITPMPPALNQIVDAVSQMSPSHAPHVPPASTTTMPEVDDFVDERGGIESVLVKSEELDSSTNGEKALHQYQEVPCGSWLRNARLPPLPARPSSAPQFEDFATRSEPGLEDFIRRGRAAW